MNKLQGNAEMPNKKTIREWSRFGWAHYKHRVMEHLGETDFSKDLPAEYRDAFLAANRGDSKDWIL